MYRLQFKDHVNMMNTITTDSQQHNKSGQNLHPGYTATKNKIQLVKI